MLSASTMAFLLGLGLLGYYLYARNRSSRKRRLTIGFGQQSQGTCVLLYDGQSMTIHKAERSTSGSFIVDGAEFPPILAKRVDETFALPYTLYLIAVEPVALHQHRELERVRFSILVGNIFKPAGDMVELLRIVGACLVIGVAVFVYTQVSSINSALARQEAQVELVIKKLNDPFVIAAPVEPKK